MNEARNGSKFLGRDHHPRAFTMWLAGGGIKPGDHHRPHRRPRLQRRRGSVDVHDLHATMLHLLGIDHEKLTYKFQGDLHADRPDPAAEAAGDRSPGGARDALPAGAAQRQQHGRGMHSYPIYQDFQKKAEPLAEVLCRRLVPASVSIDNQTERVEAEMVSGNYFTMLGVKPAVGPRLQLEGRRSRSIRATRSSCSATTTGSTASPAIRASSARRSSSTTTR